MKSSTYGAKTVLLSNGTATAEDLERVRRTVVDGGVIVYPAGTVYGIGGNGFDPAVAQRIARIKGRDRTSFILLCDRLESALALGAIWPRAAMDLAARHWPGPLTLVVPASDPVPSYLRAADGTVAIRVDAHPFSRALASAAGCPLISTSANFSGRPPATSWAEVEQTLLDACDLFVVDHGIIDGITSTLVSFKDDRPVVLRHGAIPEDLL
ncbi:MAG TPA: L-threonylcarbamoyladenylate synthase [Myxococcota bacterium]|nr:L-threonylcarbamoyladenylate synthase [Myxococcota bacterium]HPV04296.1 L-threonylcarbamoyladenylate synthase [Myxococcota bacterium]